jgi:hypothetical protein
MKEFDYHHLKEPAWGSVTSADFDSKNKGSIHTRLSDLIKILLYYFTNEIKNIA